MDRAKVDQICNQLLKQTELLHFLPMLFVGWADGVLSPTEIDLIRDKITKTSGLSKESKDTLVGYLDPTNPPSWEDMEAWLCIIRKHKVDQSSPERLGLVELGARVAGMGEADYKPDASTLSALHEVEDALGVVSHEATLRLLGSGRRPPAGEAVEEPPTFDVSEMSSLLDGDQHEMRQRIRQLLRDPAFSYEEFENRDAYREKVLEWCKILAEQGIGALSYPESVGGKNDMAGFVAAFETLAYHDLNLVIKFGVQFGLFGGSILGLGTESHYQKYLPGAGTLELPGCFAMTELGHGSNVRDIETTAVYEKDSNEFIIHTPTDNAHKHYIGNAALHGKIATVFAQLEIAGERYGVHAFVVPLRDDSGNILPGVRIEDCGRKIGLNGVDNGKIWFDSVRIPRENLLNRFAEVSPQGYYSSSIRSIPARFFTMLGTLVGGRVSISASGLSAAKSGLAIAIRYASMRRQFGPDGSPETVLLDYRTHQRRLMPLVAKAYALDFAQKYLTNRFVNRTESDVREVEALAAGLKAYSTWNTTKTLQECREACGGQGYISANRIGDLKADSDIFTTFEGDNTVLMQLVARGRLTDFKKQFSGTRFFGILKYVAGQAANVIAEKNPVIVRNSDSFHLRSIEYHSSIFKARESDLLSTAAGRLKKRIDAGMDSYEAFIECQDHLIALAKAYVERVILEQFLTGIENCKTVELKQALIVLEQLFALSVIEEHRGWYLEEGYMEGNKAKAIRREVNKLCFEVRKQALNYVESFAIPDSCLSAPIAFRNPA
ncbi:MAG: acyl-CoA dehydrogenase [Calditrichota bacterium]